MATKAAKAKKPTEQKALFTKPMQPMRSVTDMTWKDGAVVEIRSLIGRLEDNATSLDREFSAYAEREPRMKKAIETANSLTRQAVRLADIIENIKEAK